MGIFWNLLRQSDLLGSSMPIYGRQLFLCTAYDAGSGAVKEIVSLYDAWYNSVVVSTVRLFA